MSDEKEQVKAGLQRWTTCFNEGKFDLIPSCYAEGAVLLPPEGPRLTDRSIFGDVMKALLDKGIVRFGHETVDIEVTKEFAWMCNIATGYDSDNKEVMKFKTLEVYKKVDDAWFLYRDMFSPV